MGYRIFLGLIRLSLALVAWMFVLAAGIYLLEHHALGRPWYARELFIIVPGCAVVLYWVWRMIHGASADVSARLQYRRWRRL